MGSVDGSAVGALVACSQFSADRFDDLAMSCVRCGHLPAEHERALVLAELFVAETESSDSVIEQLLARRAS